MKPHDVARLIGIGDSTVRAWSSEFAEYLSPTAVGGDNRRRDFTLQDRQIMAVVKRMTDHNTPREEIHVELKRLQDGDWRELEPTTSAPDDSSAIVPAGGDMALAFNVERRSLVREIATLQNDVRDMKAELSTERALRLQDLENKLREITELERKLSRAETLLELYEQGKLKPPG